MECLALIPVVGFDHFALIFPSLVDLIRMAVTYENACHSSSIFFTMGHSFSSQRSTVPYSDNIISVQ